MSDEAVLEVHGLTAGYGQTPVIRDVNLEVRSGEVVTLLGANGAGKTTTLRTISRVIPSNSGTVRLDGVDLAGVAANKRHRSGRIAHVPEGRGIFPGLTVAEHFRLGHRSERLDSHLAYDYFPALAELRSRRAGLLSGGEQQMLAVGRALARSPRLLLIDELSLGLAPIIVEKLLPVIRQYAQQSSCGVLLVEQHVGLALAFADRGYVLARGEISLHGTADRLRTDHDLVVASYLGRSAPAGSPDPIETAPREG